MPLYDPKLLVEDKIFFAKKLGISVSEFEALVDQPVHHFSEFPNHQRKRRLLVSNFPEMSQFVDEYDCCWKVDPNEHALLSLIQNLTPIKLSSKRANARTSDQSYCWLEEERELLAMYKSLGFAKKTDSFNRSQTAGLKS